ncbi:enoyl-CoA hydratase-related protein [Metallumcola ferriviriculae]|uniref:short-chain-enoyl-CoA hydratase n=1 Tax=Metallumcola ferriviriculae TaxID=3039180 RepID=A0AAU0UQ43_9FIRM|nr:enoyl-CoA hydratase-related protein [Desulfitibacteraceae bacterium MK1]
MGKLVKLVIKDKIAEVTIDNPPVNALNAQVIQELDETVEVIKGEEVGAVIITGAGEKAFVAGADISQFPSLNSDTGKKMVQTGQRVFDKIAALPIPVIGAIDGFALGGGCELALVCDIRIASEKARLGLPEVNLAIIPGYGGTQRLARLIGEGKAKELIFTADAVMAQEALQIGLVERVVPAGETVNAAREMAQKILSKGPLAIRKAKQAIDEGLKGSLRDGLDIEADLVGELFATEDLKEGATAFLKKRKPNYKGL